MQQSLFQLDPVRSTELQRAIDLMAMSGVEDRGAVFTRKVVVEFILDLAGYRADADLARCRLLEPSCGRGDFLLVAINRLLDAYQRSGHPMTECVPILTDAIRAVELHRQTFLATQARVHQLLRDREVPQAAASALVTSWLIQDDFLLARLPPSFTHIIGNPPYVRLERIPAELLRAYRAQYTTVYDRADLYIPFIERCLALLAPNGKLAFICSDRWLKNRYGGPLRKIIARNFHLQHYVDMTGTDAFHAPVTAYPAIIVIAAGKGTTTQVVRQPNLDEAALQQLAARLCATDLSDHPDIQLVTELPKGTHPWILSATDDERQVLRRLEHEFPVLEAVGCKVGIGAATGCDRVYIGQPDTLPIEADRKVPLVQTQDIRSGIVRWSGNVIVNTFTDSGELVSLSEYPLLAAYFMRHERVLRARHVARKNNPAAWYRTIDRIHPGLAELPKLLIPDIKADANVVFDEGRYYPHHNLYYVTTTTWDLRALQAILRSSIARIFVAAYSIRMRAGYLRFQAQYVRQIHIPEWSAISEQTRGQLIAAAVANDLEAMNEATCDAYQLSASERALVLRNVSELRPRGGH